MTDIVIGLKDDVVPTFDSLPTLYFGGYWSWGCNEVLLLVVVYYFILDPSLEAYDPTLEEDIYLVLDLFIRLFLLSDLFNNLLFSSSFESIIAWNFSLKDINYLAFCLNSSLYISIELFSRMYLVYYSKTVK